MDAETQAERQARQFAQLRRLGDLAMSIAEAAGAAVLAESKQSPEDPGPAPGRPNHARLFMQAAAAVKQIIALELRVEAGPSAQRSASRTPAAPAAPAPPDPRRPLLRHVLHDAVRNDPDRARRRRQIDEKIEHELLADPAGAELIAETLGAVCRSLHIDIDPARLPDEFLEFNEPIKRLTRSKTREPPS